MVIKQGNGNKDKCLFSQQEKKGNEKIHKIKTV